MNKVKMLWENWGKLKHRHMVLCAKRNCVGIYWNAVGVPD